MINYLLDTNHLSPLVTPYHPLGKRVLQQIEAGDTFSLCVPILTEFMFGIRMIPRAKFNIAVWKQIQPMFHCYKLDPIDGDVAADLQVILQGRGWQLKTVDALIAAIALRYELILLTTDKDFLAVPGLHIENWMIS